MDKHKDAFFEDTQVLKNIAIHLQFIASEISCISETVSYLTNTYMSPQKPEIKHLQKIDSVHQSISDLSVLTDALSEKSFFRQSAIEQLKLASTRRLVLRDSTPSGIESGSVDLF